MTNWRRRTTANHTSSWPSQGPHRHGAQNLQVHRREARGVVHVALALRHAVTLSRAVALPGAVTLRHAVDLRRAPESDAEPPPHRTLGSEFDKSCATAGAYLPRTPGARWRS